MIENEITKRSPRADLLRGAIEHRATWFALMIEEAKKIGLDDKFASSAVFRCGQFHGTNKFTQTDDLENFAAEFANDDVVETFEMEILKNDGTQLNINFHYCPLVAAWEKLGIPEEDIPRLCDMAMDGDRGIVSEFDAFDFELGKTIAAGDGVCEIRIRKKEDKK